MNDDQTAAADALGLTDVFAEMLAGLRRRGELRAAHRAECAKRPCERCELWVCRVCGKDSENPPDDRDDMKRPALCERCTRQWDRNLILAPAVESILSDWYRQAVPGNAGTAFMLKNVPSYSEIRKSLGGVVGRPGSCVLSGPTRAGKTLTGSFMIRMVIEAGRDSAATPAQIRMAKEARCVPALEIAAARAQHPLGKGEAPRIREALDASVLLLDDCGQEDEFGKQAIRQVLMARDRRPTWVTTFLSKEEFGVRYGGGAVSRLCETGTWFDLRGAP